MGGILSTGQRNSLIGKLGSAAKGMKLAELAKGKSGERRRAKWQLTLKAAWLAFPENKQDKAIPTADEALAIVDRLDNEERAEKRREAIAKRMSRD